MAVLDNRFREQQSRGLLVKRNHVLIRDNLHQLYQSPSLSRQTLNDFQSRLVFNLALLINMRPSALCALTTDQFQHVKMDDTMA